MWFVSDRLLFIQVLAVENVNFGVHVENQTGVRDGLSRKHHRVYQLYSRTSGKHVQVLGKKITAMGEDGDKYGKFACLCKKQHTLDFWQLINCNTSINQRIEKEL